MCTLVLLRRPGHEWPILLAGNRDEMKTRPTRPPARHWPEQPEVIAGKDELAGGTWLGLTDFGFAAVVMNRHGTLGPKDGMRSRGELVLEALKHPDAISAARAIGDLKPGDYRGFNLVLADHANAFWLRHRDEKGIEIFEIGPGLHMLSAGDLDDPAEPRLHRYHPRFRAAQTPNPETGDWKAWKDLLHCRLHVEPEGEEAAMFQDRPSGFATVSSHLIALPASEDSNPLFEYRDWVDGDADFSSALA